jgi:hypothetical protein
MLCNTQPLSHHQYHMPHEKLLIWNVMYIISNLRPYRGGHSWHPNAPSTEKYGNSGWKAGAARSVPCGMGDAPHLATPAANHIWCSWPCSCQTVHGCCPMWDAGHPIRLSHQRSHVPLLQSCVISGACSRALCTVVVRHWSQTLCPYSQHHEY